MTYSEKLKSPKWQKKRLEILSRDEFKCCKCGDTETSLQVHHKLYKKGAEPWEYEDENFDTLCENCHLLETALGAITTIHRVIKKNIGKLIVLYFFNTSKEEQMKCVGIAHIEESNLKIVAIISDKDMEIFKDLLNTK